MKISACMIVKNESANIEKCIESYRNIVDEIIVVDTGSEDNTVELALKANATVLYREWDNDFSAPKNMAIEQATGDWIVFLDADEYFDAGSSNRLLDSMQRELQNNEINAICCKMIHIDPENGAVLGSNPVTRVFRRKDSIRYINSVHEEARDNGNILRAAEAKDVVIYHTGYSASRLTGKFIRNLEILKQKELEGFADLISYYYMAGSYSGLSRFPEAVVYADKALDEEKRTGQRIPEKFRYKLFAIKLNSMLALRSKFDSCVLNQAIDDASAQYPAHPEIMRCKAQFLKNEKRIRKSLASFIKALELHEKFDKLGFNDFDAYLSETYCTIGILYTYLNKEGEAFEWFIKALKTDKFNKYAVFRLLKLARYNKPEEIILLLKQFYDSANIKDVGFLIKILCDLNIPVPLVYYTKIWNNTFEQEDISVLYAMMALGRYDEAADIAMALAEKNNDRSGIHLALCAIVCGGFKEQYIERIKSIDETAYRLICLLIKGEKGVILDQSFTVKMQELLNYLIPISNDTITSEYLNFVLEHFSDLSSFLLFDQLMLHNKYTLAQEYYGRLFERTKNKNLKANCAFTAGFSAYKNHKNSDALEMFTEAIKYGYRDAELLECLEIMQDGDGESALQNDITKVKDLFLPTKEVSVPNRGFGKLADYRFNASSFMFEETPLVSIIVLAYNKVEFTRQCIESIYKYTEGIDYELLVVNNGSTDGTQFYFESLPKKRIVQIEKNHGPCHGFNEGIKAARGRYVACVCNDFIFTKNWLSNLITCIQSDDEIGYVSPGASYMSNFQQINGNYKMLEEMQKFAEKYNVSDPTKWEERIRLLPNVLFVKREIFDIVGYYDPIFIYGEFADDDIAFRIRRAGYKLVYAGDTFTHHYGSVTTRKDQRENKSLELSREIFKKKHGIDAWADVQYDTNLINFIEYREVPKESNIRILGIDPLCGATLLQIKNGFKYKFNVNTELYASVENPVYYTDLATICREVICGNIKNTAERYAGFKFDYIILNTPLNEYDSYISILPDLAALLNNDGHIIASYKNNISLDHRNLEEQAISTFIGEFRKFGDKLCENHLKIVKCINESINLSDEQNKELEEVYSRLKDTDTKQARDILTLNRYLLDIAKC